MPSPTETAIFNAVLDGGVLLVTVRLTFLVAALHLGWRAGMARLLVEVQP